MGHPEYPGLELSEDLRQQRREWRMQRIIWPILYLLLLAIIFGLIGKGPLSETEAGKAGDDLHLKYQRFLRHDAPDKLELTMQATSDTVRVAFDSEYIRKIEIERIKPTPERVISSADSMIFVFHGRASTPVHAELYFKPERVGFLRAWVALGNQPRLEFTQFVYP